MKLSTGLNNGKVSTMTTARAEAGVRGGAFLEMHQELKDLFETPMGYALRAYMKQLRSMREDGSLSDEHFYRLKFSVEFLQGRLALAIDSSIIEDVDDFSAESS